MTGHGWKHDRSWSWTKSGENLLRAWSVMAQPWPVMVLSKMLLDNFSWSVMSSWPVMLEDKNKGRRLGGMIDHGPAMIGHASRQKHTGRKTMIGHEFMTGHASGQNNTLFFQLPEMIFNDFFLSKASLINWKVI